MGQSLTQKLDFHDLFIQNEKKHIKIVIPKSIFKDIRQLLNDFNCNSRTLMPGIDGYSKYFQNLSIPSDLPPRSGSPFAIEFIS